MVTAITGGKVVTEDGQIIIGTVLIENNISPGKLADIIAFDDNIDVAMVMVDGIMQYPAT